MSLHSLTRKTSSALSHGFLSRAIIPLAVLSLALALSGCGGGSDASLQPVGRQDITVAQLATMLQDGQPLILLDVRTAEEFAGGHIAQATNVPVADIPTWDGAAKQARIACICKAGSRSLIAADTLVARGFTRVYNVLGGMSAWQGETQSSALGVSPAQLLVMYNDGQPLVIVDVCSPASYALRHIAGSLSLPLENIDTWATSLDKGKRIACAST